MMASKSARATLLNKADPFYSLQSGHLTGNLRWALSSDKVEHGVRAGSKFGYDPAGVVDDNRRRCARRTESQPSNGMRVEQHARLEPLLPVCSWRPLRNHKELRIVTGTIPLECLHIFKDL